MDKEGDKVYDSGSNEEKKECFHKPKSSLCQKVGAYTKQNKAPKKKEESFCQEDIGKGIISDCFVHCSILELLFS